MALIRTQEQKWEDSCYGAMHTEFTVSWSEVLAKYDIDINNVRCGVSAGEGWKLIIESLIVALIAIGWDKDIHQIKEKFGSLRFYVGKHDAFMQDLIFRAEDMTKTTCEACGAKGEIKDWGGRKYYKCLCDKHGKIWAERHSYVRPGYVK